ncbi:DUF1552 domain-containing protein [Pedosphaera parvula]|uniref:DUF1552 domain-containing protein n=1 Tax=Pedosphaera parvula (strain Ellin514) TaxID=320771 RepID=B9XER7_PEDPL|nr:DUF1552 domain-containing protein [Pedosphaera parvula]EEF61781.1 protein of unknown function DUF1552 [Pedosphaera parvula Ellin514]
MQNWKISRRTMLKGVGAMLSLPMLEAMAPRSLFANSAASTATRSFPVRMAVLYMANGVNPHHWTPKGVGHDFELSPILQPLSKLKDELLVLTQLMNAKTEGGDGHYVKTAAFLTGTTITRTTGSDLRCGGTSMDQIAAQRIGNLTTLPSLELGIEPVTTGVDRTVGYTRLYGSHIAWSTPTTPVAKEINPQLAFDRMFRTGDAGGKNSTADKSVVDLVMEDARRLKSKVGQADQAKINEYLDSVRAVEKRIEFDAKRTREEYRADPLVRREIDKLGARIKDFYLDPAQASERSGNHTEHVRLMLDLMVLAFWSDSTRISTFMFGNAVSTKNFSFLDGVKGSHHEISHHHSDEKKLEQYKLINIWHMTQLAYMLEKMQSIQEGERTLLDNSMVLFGAGMRDGNEHNPHNLPILLAGQGGGTLSPGRHLVYEKNTPLCNLYRSMLTRMGTPVDQFSDSTGELPGLNDPAFKGVGNSKA